MTFKFLFQKYNNNLFLVTLLESKIHAINDKISVKLLKKEDEMHNFLHLVGKKSCQFTFNCYIANLIFNELT